MSPRKRSEKNAWLNDYPGLYVTTDGRFYVRHPVTHNQVNLGTKLPQKAKALYVRIAQRWDEERGEVSADIL